ncbi:MAG: trypsin-like peptidase domain-containing protein [Candidatus Kapabacteria bacterium]|nr:trypsin-like peptidase domain-containing protein [Ignavibacteria bacterium]MBP6510848.1 trypsin-like peptidase domain-containing protein [Candidatus Kapabacteria bacterium]MBK6761236.1 trypsin-like peptidase domain-containing protein [Ignavibacteria bacterium]MBK7412411.1 trypsin-like peptidase domain-containing protein [Ignavibacteria bacterium]MBK7577536.1 trypsin-like peptidase domain-containing protein [Ignavibacteria bacterium]
MTKTPFTSFFTAMMMALAAHPMAACKPDTEMAISEPVYTNSQPANDDVSGSRKNAITRAVSKSSPAIVGINVTETRTQYYRDPWDDFFGDPFFRNHYGDRPRTYKRDYEVRSLGSGFLISADGYILTNDHVAGNASKIVVTMTDGTKHDARIIGTDPVSDVAVLKIDGGGFPFLKLSNSDDVEVGEWAIAFGNPFGLFDNNAKPTVTVGVVSNVGVSFTQPGEGGEDRVYKNMIQTDAAISSGNSGGPLVNALGEVIGVNTVIYSTSQSARGSGSIGIGFAIPINRVKAIVDRLQKDGSIRRDFWTGMKLSAIDENVARYFKLSGTDGVLVSEVATDGPADDAGIEPGDVIIAINGRPTLRDEDVNIAILDGEVNQKLKLTVLRSGEKKDLTMTLQARPRSGGVRN